MDADSKASALQTWAAQRVNGTTPQASLRLPSGDKPGVLRHPFKLADRTQYLQQIKGSGVFKRAEDAKIEDVPLSDLWGVQRHVNAERLQSHLESPDLVPAGARGPGHGGLIDIPTVVRIGGKSVIHDGHHRATAAHLRGQPSIRARVVDLDAAGWSNGRSIDRPTGDPPKLTGV